MLDAFRTVRGIVRSLRIYYGDRRHGPAMDRLYRQFVRPGDLVFDIGAHVGDRVAAFRRLQARVIAVTETIAGLSPDQLADRLMRIVSLMITGSDYADDNMPAEFDRSAA